MTTCSFSPPPKDDPSQASSGVMFFRPQAIQAGQKIHILEGPRRGDWQVIEVGERKMKLKCPISFKEIEVEHFLTFVEERTDVPWPQKH